MKTSHRLGLIALALALFSLVALAAPNVDIDGNVRWMRAGFWVMPQTIGGQTVAANKVTRMLGVSAVIDVLTATGACNDSAGVTLTGAQVGDPCLVGPPTTITGAGTGLSAAFTCYVSAANTVVLRHCVTGVAADDPASATWYFRVISSQ